MSESYHAVQPRKKCNHALTSTGIYEIRHILSKKIYIGSAICVRCRWNAHKFDLRKNTHRNGYLQAAWNKYGEEAFCFKLIEECAYGLLIEREQHWIDTTNCTDDKVGFNISPTAWSQLGFRHSEASKKRISQVKSNPSAETRERMRQAGLGRVRPESERIKISENSATRKLTREQVIEIQERYEASQHAITQTQLAKEYGVSTHTISLIVRRKGERYQTDVPLSDLPTRRGNPVSRKHTEETRAKMSASHKGHLTSEETRRKIGEAQRGKSSHRKGKSLSEEHKQKIGEANRGRRLTEERKKEISEHQKGRRLTEEHRRHISEGHLRRRGKSNEY